MKNALLHSKYARYGLQNNTVLVQNICVSSFVFRRKDLVSRAVFL